jgi:hypothetical protein
MCTLQSKDSKGRTVPRVQFNLDRRWYVAVQTCKKCYEPQKEMEILVIETRARPDAFKRCEGRDLPLIDIPCISGLDFFLVHTMADSTYIE